MLPRIARAILFLIALLVACPLRVHAPAAGLDASWAVALNDAAASGLVHGRDIAFTYGPWAWVALPMGANVDAALRWQCAMWAVYAAVLIYLFFFRQSRLLNLALFAACVYQGARTFVDYGYAGPDIFLAFTVLLLLVCASDSMYWLLFLCAAIALAGALFLIKLTSGIFAASAIVLWALASKRPIGIAAAVCGVPAALATAFFLHHPSVDVLLRYVRVALEISSEFSVAMSSPGETPADLRDAGLLAAGFVALGAALAWRKQNKAFALALSLAGPLFLSFKHSFIRPAGHMEILFTTAPLLLAAVIPAVDFEGRKNWPVWVTVAVLAAVWIPRSGTLTPRPWPVVSIAGDGLAPDRIEGLPNVPTAVFPFEAAIPVASGVVSRPFPLIQAYQSYTRSLDAWNAESIVHAEQIVLHWDIVDGRHPFLDAPALTLAMMRHYDFAQDLGQRILLRRRATPRFGAPRKTGEAVLKIGEPLKLPVSSSKPQVLRVDLKLDPRGQLRKLLWKLPEARILLSAPGGRVLAARLVPDVIGNAGGLSFMPASLGDLRRMLEDAVLPEPYDEMVIDAEYYVREARVEFFEIEDWPKVRIDRDADAPDLGRLLNQGEARAAKIDSLNDVGVASLGAKEVPAIDAGSGYVMVKGWAFDYVERKPASAVYLELDGGKGYAKATYGESRLDNVALFDHNPALAPTGFSAAIPKTRLGAGEHALRVVAISADGKKYAIGSQRVAFRLLP